MPKEDSPSSCCPSPASCGADNTSMGRRKFLKTTGLVSAMLMAGRVKAMAGPFEATDFDKIIPADKKLSKDWIAGLYARGKPLSAASGELHYIGMPISGIGTGQVYLGGDGQLRYWYLEALKDKKHTPKGYRYMEPDTAYSPLGQGFALQVNGKVHTLDAKGFADVKSMPMTPVRRKYNCRPIRHSSH